MNLSVFAPAKVNLYLAVGAQRPDGFHAVDTIMQSVAVGDTVTIEESSAFSFACSPDPGVPPDKNLAHRAVVAMARRFSRPASVTVSIDKRIPAGSGLGGASADAAAAIAGLAELWGIDADHPGLVEVARSLGSDVPFFLEGGAARYTGRGDVLMHRLPSLDAPLVLVCPPERISTAEAYRAFDSLDAAIAPSPGPLEEALRREDVQSVARMLFNAMTGSSARLVDGIGSALAFVSSHPGVIGASMSGSGSAVFGICESDSAAVSCARSAQGSGFWAAATRAFERGVVVHRA